MTKKRPDFRGEAHKKKDFWDEESKANTKRKQTPTFIKTILVHVFTHASKKNPLTRTYTTIRSYIPSVLSDLKCSDVKKKYLSVTFH